MQCVCVCVSLSYSLYGEIVNALFLEETVKCGKLVQGSKSTVMLKTLVVPVICVPLSSVGIYL